MGLPDPFITTALFAALLLATLWMRRRRQSGTTGRQVPRDFLDTVQAWPPEAARVLTVSERKAYDLLRSAAPGLLVLAQVPLSRFLRVPTRHSYAEWVQRVGCLSADLLVCDTGSRVLAVIDIQPASQSERARKRHERMARVLKAAGISVYVWSETNLPNVSDVRSMLGADLERTAGQAPAAKPTKSQPMPLNSAADLEQLLADGDRLALDASMEPVPSAFFDEIETAAPAARGGHA